MVLFNLYPTAYDNYRQFTGITTILLSILITLKFIGPDVCVNSMYTIMITFVIDIIIGPILQNLSVFSQVVTLE